MPMMMTCARFISKESLIVYTHGQGWWDNNADGNDNKTKNEKKNDRIHVASVCQADRPTLQAGQAEQEIPPDNIGCSSPKQ